MRKFYAPLLASLLLIILLSPGYAAEPPAAPGTASPAQVYRLRAGDTLDITVTGEPTYSGTFVIGAGGGVVFADGVTGEIPVAGLTLGEAKLKISKRLSEYVRHPMVSLQISKFRISVTGEVLKPGSYEMTAGQTISDAIANAGGTKRELIYMKISLLRASGEEIAIEPQSFLGGGNASQNLPLLPGDVIAVGRGIPGAPGGGDYKAVGEVLSPGSYYFSKNQQPRIYDLYNAAGRCTPDADACAAKLRKQNGNVIPVNLMVINDQPNDPNNLPLEPGDELSVPRMTTHISIQGGVSKPGDYVVGSGTTFMAALAKAGGWTANANLKECAIVRGAMGPVGTGGVAAQRQVIKVNLESVIKKGDISADPPIQNGDMLVVTSKDPNGKTFLQRVGEVLGPLSWILR